MNRREFSKVAIITPFLSFDQSYYERLHHLKNAFKKQIEESKPLGISFYNKPWIEYYRWAKANFATNEKKIADIMFHRYQLGNHTTCFDFKTQIGDKLLYCCIVKESTLILEIIVDRQLPFLAKTHDVVQFNKIPRIAPT